MTGPLKLGLATTYGKFDPDAKPFTPRFTGPGVIMTDQLPRLTRQNLPECAFTWASSIHAQNVQKGWWSKGVKGRDLVETMLLIKSELIEAFEEYRKPDSTPSRVYTVEGSEKPEGIPIEIADDAIRTLDLMGALCREYHIEISASAWSVPQSFVADSMAQAIDDEFLELGRVRIGYDTARAGDGDEAACRYLVPQLAAHLVRLFRFADAKGFDLGEAIERKHAYNATRAFRHGNKKA